jgi:ribosomal protein S4E
MKTKLFTMMSVVVALGAILSTAINAENPAAGPAPQTSLQCTTSNASVTKKTILGKTKFEHKALVSITTGENIIRKGTVIKYSVNGYQPKSYTVTDEFGIQQFATKVLGWYSILLDEAEQWPQGCSATYITK